jgi:hypothetical protein
MDKQKEVKQIYKNTIDLLNKHEIQGSKASALISMLAVSVIEAIGIKLTPQQELNNGESK